MNRLLGLGLVLLFFFSFVYSFTATNVAVQSTNNSNQYPQKKSVRASDDRYYSHSNGSPSQGKEHSEITKIQLRLKELGYDCGDIDGINGPITKYAIISFQRDMHLIVDGVVGPVTRKVLKI